MVTKVFECIILKLLLYKNGQVRSGEADWVYAVKEKLGLRCLSECFCKYLPSRQDDPGLSFTFAATFWYHLLSCVFALCRPVVA